MDIIRLKEPTGSPYGANAMTLDNNILPFGSHNVAFIVLQKFKNTNTTRHILTHPKYTL
jgi:hypothetical protein